jgi:transcriptional regulator with XRE-family HTH domain
MIFSIYYFVHTLHTRLKEIRLSLRISQEAIGAQGFVSTSGWVKIESGTRAPSDALIGKLVKWLSRDGYVTAREGGHLEKELLALKYQKHQSAYIRDLALEDHRRLQTSGGLMLLAEKGPAYGAKPVRQRRKPGN